MSNVKNIDAKQLKTWLNAHEVTLVDVREPNEFSDWHIPHAISMPLTNIDEYLAHFDGNKRKVVFQCLKGKRGEMAAEAALAKFGDAFEIYNLTGGIEAWDAAGFLLIRDAKQVAGKKAPMSIMRQVQAMVGGLILCFSLLALLGLKFGAFMTLLLGSGLLFAGLTGNCGMAMLLEKMPWNKK